MKYLYLHVRARPRYHVNLTLSLLSDQCQNSPAASQEIWLHTVWRTWLFIAYSDEKWLYYKFSLHHSHNRFLKGWENTLFELRSERVNTLMSSFCLLLLVLLFHGHCRRHLQTLVLKLLSNPGLLSYGSWADTYVDRYVWLDKFMYSWQ